MQPAASEGRMPFSRPQTAQQAVLAEIRGLITRGEIPPGTAILQEALAERFGVSRVPVREALRILEGEGHVVHTAHRGYTVTQLGVSDLLEVYRLRSLLETDVASEAVPRISEQHLVRMRQAMDEMDDAADTEDLVKFGIHNRVFHFTLFEPSGMDRAIRMIRHLWDLTDPYRSLYFVKPLNRESVNSEHEEILDACRTRDAELVVRLLDAHRSHVVEDLRARDDSWSS